MVIKTVLIIANCQKTEARPLAEEIHNFLAERDVHADIFTFPLQEIPQFGQGYDLAITLGGDGTVLSAARLVAPMGIPLFSINVGTFGFITAFNKHDWQSDLAKVLEGNASLIERLMLTFFLKGMEGEDQTGQAMNDVVISGSGISKLIKLVVHIDDSERIEYRADGIIFSTPTGSTAYSAAAGGPILHPEMAAIILNPICPFTLSHRPLVLPATASLKIEILPQPRTDLMLTVDGQRTYALAAGDELVIGQSNTPAKMVYSGDRNFYEVLRAKLNWAGGPE